MNGEELRAIGRLEGKMDAMCDSVHSMDSKIDHLQQHGCALGGENVRRIKTLERTPRRTAMVSGGVVATVLCGIAEAMRWLLGKQ